MKMKTNINYPTINDLVGKNANLSIDEIICDRTYDFIITSNNKLLIEAMENCHIAFENCDGKVVIVYW